MNPGRREAVLSAQEMADLDRRTAELRALREGCQRLAGQLDRAPKSSRRALVRARLLCVLADRITPAIADLESIAGGAREPRNGAG